MQGERRYETTVELKVIAALIGDGPNQETPKFVRRENAVSFKILRERSILDPTIDPERSSQTHQIKTPLKNEFDAFNDYLLEKTIV